jgi:tetratricopeptide (TPR) repeat protein
MFLLVCLVGLTGCMRTASIHPSMQRVAELKGEAFMSSHMMTDNPRDGDMHMANGYALLVANNAATEDLFFARSAFERASVIRVDDPAPEYLRAYTYFELGQYNDALLAFISAALLDRTSDAWWLAALSSLRAGHEVLAYSLFLKGKEEGEATSPTLEQFMRALYESPADSSDVITESRPRPIAGLRCVDPSQAIDGVEALCASDLQAEFYLVERAVSAGAAEGQDLLQDLSLVISGSNSRTTGSAVDVRETNLSLDVPSLTYDLSIASNSKSSTTVKATPKMRVRLNEASTINIGSLVTIVADNADISRGVDRTSGVSISATLGWFTDVGGQIIVGVNISDKSIFSVTEGFGQLVNNESDLQSAAEVRYNEAFVLGSMQFEEFIVTGSGQAGLQKLPVLGALFRRNTNEVIDKELVVLGILRQPEQIANNKEARLLDALTRVDVQPQSSARRRPIVHMAPTLRQVFSDLNIL